MADVKDLLGTEVKARLSGWDAVQEDSYVDSYEKGLDILPVFAETDEWQEGELHGFTVNEGTDGEFFKYLVNGNTVDEDSIEALAVTAGGKGSGRYPKGSGGEKAAGVAPSAGAEHIGADGVLGGSNAEDYFTDRYGDPKAKSGVIGPAGNEVNNAVAAKISAAQAVGKHLSGIPAVDCLAASDSMSIMSRKAQDYQKAIDNGTRVGINGSRGLHEDPNGPVAGTPQADALMRNYAAGMMIGKWAATSGDNDGGAIALQKATEREFGLKDTGRFDDTDRADQILGKHEAALRGFARAQYDATQAQLAADGIKEITVYRGMTGSATAGEGVPVKLRPASSFSVNRGTAEAFARDDAGTGGGGRGPGHLVTMKVPVGRILGMPGTGMGSLEERELVVLGGTYPSDVSRVSR